MSEALVKNGKNYGGLKNKSDPHSELIGTAKWKSLILSWLTASDSSFHVEKRKTSIGWLEEFVQYRISLEIRGIR